MPALLSRLEVDSLQVLDAFRPGLDQREAVGLNAEGDAPNPIGARVDVRNRLTLESFLAASFAAEEAGGSLVDRKGNPLGALAELEQRARLIPAASSELAKEIVNVLAPSNH